MAKPNGFIIWEGASLIDGAPIVAIVTGTHRPTANPKTGPMLQTWILRRDIAPGDAVRSGDDVSVCGSCQHRGINGEKRTCYVRIHNAPRAVWETYRRGGYPNATRAELADIGALRPVRLGAYGDPCAVPAGIWEELCARTPGRTGYTHQWRESRAHAYQHLVMASADSVADLAAARATGWRAFRVRGTGEPLEAGEVTCPASDEGGKRTTCAECKLCAGSMDGRKRRAPDVGIIVHGAGKSHFVSMDPKA